MLNIAKMYFFFVGKCKLWNVKTFVNKYSLFFVVELFFYKYYLFFRKNIFNYVHFLDMPKKIKSQLIGNKKQLIINIIVSSFVILSLAFYS